MSEQVLLLNLHMHDLSSHTCTLLAPASTTHQLHYQAAEPVADTWQGKHGASNKRCHHPPNGLNLHAGRLNSPCGACNAQCWSGDCALQSCKLTHKVTCRCGRL